MTFVHNVFPLIVGLWCLLAFTCVHHVFGLRSFSKNEDFEIQKTINLLTEHVVMTVKTTYGDEYNCIDFHKQHAFQHPALKHRASEFKMTSSTESSSESSWATKMWENGKGCPSGTVPVKKYTKRDLIGAKRMAEIHASKFNLSTHPTDNNDPNSYHHAVIRSGAPSSYGGISMFTSLYNPSVQDTQFSSSQMKISSGGEFLQTGWTVNPPLYHDHRTRLFLFTGAKSSNCFNDFCPGFVKDSTSVPLDYAFDEISTPGGKTFDWKFLINTDKSGKWFLHFGSEESNVTIGYWPKEIFAADGLGKFADKVEWGGEIYSPPGTVGWPQMGSGHDTFRQTSKWTAYDINLKVQNQSGQLIDVPGGIETSAEYPYRMAYLGNQGTYFEQSCFFGGPIAA